MRKGRTNSWDERKGYAFGGDFKRKLVHVVDWEEDWLQGKCHTFLGALILPEGRFIVKYIDHKPFVC